MHLSHIKCNENNAIATKATAFITEKALTPCLRLGCGLFRMAQREAGYADSRLYSTVIVEA